MIGLKNTPLAILEEVDIEEDLEELQKHTQFVKTQFLRAHNIYCEKIPVNYRTIFLN